MNVIDWLFGMRNLHLSVGVTQVSWELQEVTKHLLV